MERLLLFVELKKGWILPFSEYFFVRSFAKSKLFLKQIWTSPYSNSAAVPHLYKLSNKSDLLFIFEIDFS